MGRYRKLYDEDLVKEIMISAALCVQEMLLDDPKATEDEICEFIEANCGSIIQETLAMEAEAEGEADAASPEEPVDRARDDMP